jgi:outer membrane protein assembly factor BamA
MMMMPLLLVLLGAPEIEYAVVPLVGGDTDIGFGGGALASVAKVDPELKPYIWRLEGTVFFTFKHRADGFSVPYQDAFLQFTRNHLLDGRLRVEVRPSYTYETNLRYYGLGNASVAVYPEVPARDFYTRRHPALLARGRYQLGNSLYLVVGTLYTHSWIAYTPESNLNRDLTTGSPKVRSILNVDTDSGLHLIEAGLSFDNRDDEITPTEGQWHSLKVRVSPWNLPALPYRYAQFNLTARAYVSPWTNRLVLAGRLIADVQIGEVPFFELSRYDEASALGGANGVRGVPGDRYYGKRKLFGNLEARSELLFFQFWDSDYILGLTGFLDGGRLWADNGKSPELDGTGIGLKYGVGGGLRLQKGETFVLRVDTAWSPDAHPLGFYFLAGHLF